MPAPPSLLAAPAPPPPPPFPSGYVGAGLAYEDRSAIPSARSGSLVLAVNKHVTLLTEADTGYAAGGGIEALTDGVLGCYGVRFASKIIGVDLGFAKPICGDDCDDIGLAMGFPFVGFAYRSPSDRGDLTRGRA